MGMGLRFMMRIPISVKQSTFRDTLKTIDNSSLIAWGGVLFV